MPTDTITRSPEVYYAGPVAITDRRSAQAVAYSDVVQPIGSGSTREAYLLPDGNVLKVDLYPDNEAGSEKEGELWDEFDADQRALLPEVYAYGDGWIVMAHVAFTIREEKDSGRAIYCHIPGGIDHRSRLIQATGGEPWRWDTDRYKVWNSVVTHLHAESSRLHTRIGDIFNYNVGVMADGRPVILDWAYGH